jgi:hypothetical protein
MSLSMSALACYRQLTIELAGSLNSDRLFVRHYSMSESAFEE